MAEFPTWPDWPVGDDRVEYADKEDSYAVVNQGILFVPYSLVRIKRCPECDVPYANAAFLEEHIAKDHPGSERPKRPGSVPEAVAPDRVRPQPQPQSVKLPAPAKPAFGPAVQNVPDERIRAMPKAPSRRGAPRSVPSTRKQSRGR
jgi:hypothetical protein